VPGVLRVLTERLRNEITRLPAVKAITLLAGSPLVRRSAGRRPSHFRCCPP
jgi:hypothetical protein